MATHDATGHGCTDQLAARDDEIARLAALCARLQARVLDGVAAAAAARRSDAATAAMLDELHLRLAIERDEHAACRDAQRRAQQYGDEFAARLAAEQRRARSDHDDGERRRLKVESRLHRTESELASVRAALAVAEHNLRAFHDAYSDALARVEVLEAQLERHDRRRYSADRREVSAVTEQ